ncbi:MAG: neutral zinc metallopeptidase [Bacteroidales bacterium]|nr:neutral zinc metallopeptidase [Bacteroidales bacterium]
MDLNGRRESGNVEDRRGQSGGGFGGFSTGGGGFNLLQLLLQLFLMKRGSSGGGTNKASGGGQGGCGCLIIVLVLLVLFFLLGGMGGNSGCSDILGGMLSGGGAGATYGDDDTTTETPYQGTEQEEELATFTKKILAGTEDVWTAYFQKMGRTYQAPKLVLFTNAVRSGCGAASSSTGPFYCSADQTVYIDLSFFMSMKQQIGADGDFAYAYVIAHEVGHHVQNLLGTLEKVHNQMARYGQDSKEYNQLSVRLELQADFYAGVWAHQDNKMFGSLEDGDIEEGLNAASKIGDDYLQKKARGYTVPESFNHGTSAQRSKWLKLGITTGDITKGDTFSPRYENL